MKSPVEKTFVAGIGLAAAGLVAIALVQYRNLPSLMEAEREVTHVGQVLAQVNNIVSSTEDAAGMAGAFAIEEDPEYRRLQTQAVVETRARVRQLRSLVSGDQQLSHSLDVLSGLLEQYFQQLDELMRIGRTGGVQQAAHFLASGRTSRLRVALRDARRGIIAYERDRLRTNQASSERRWSRVRVLTGCALFVAVSSLAISVLLLFQAGRRRDALERELLKERYLLQTLLNNVPLGIFFKDVQHRFTRVSQAWASLLGFDEPAGLEGRTTEDFVSAEEAERQRTQDSSVLATGQAVIGEERRLSFAGQPGVCLLTSTVPLYDEHDKAMGLLGVAMDITDRKRAELAREEAAARVAEWAGQLEKHNQQENLLAELSELLQTCGTEAEAGEIIGRYLSVLCPAASGHLSLTKASRNVVESVAAWGEQKGQALVFSPDQCWALRRGRPHQSGNDRLEPACDHGCGVTGVSSYCVPMMAHGESVGVFNLSSSGPAYGEAERRLAVTVAERIGLALSNLRLRDALRVLSVRDPLTGLFNRRYMEESCEREFRRASRHGRPLSIVMVDLDHFKRFNDTFGHDAGDALLREFGALLQSHTRKEDITCRYGGEEFLLLLPELSSGQACQCAEKLRHAIADMIVNFNGQAMGRITASFGVAAFPEHGDSVSALIRAADSSLYAAKKLGRDRVTIAPAFEIDSEVAS
jgi:diguanylate cyclase (GGDEF)-like protein/PAS domain S-box-containing protein